MLNDFRKFFSFIGHKKQFLFLLLLRCPFDALRTIISANYLNMSFQAINENNSSQLYMACLFFGIGSSLLFLYNGSIWMTYAGFSIRLIRILREKLFGHVSGISQKQIESKSSGDWFTRLNADVGQASAIFSQPLNLPHAATSTVSICVSAIIISTLQPTIFFLVILFLIPHLLISQLLIAKPIRLLSKKSQETTADTTAKLNTIITCSDTAILYDGKDFLWRQFEESSKNLRKVNMKIRKQNALGDAILPMLGMSGYLTILLFGGNLIRNGQLTFSELTSLFQYRGGVLVGSLVLTNCFITIKTSLAGVQRVLETMEMNEEG